MEHEGNAVPEPQVAEARQYRRRAEADWRELLARWAETDETVAAFCLRENANACQFYAWRRRLQIGVVASRRSSLAADGQAGGFVEAVVVEKATALAAEASEYLEIVLRNGRRVRVTGGVDEELLKRVVRSLEAI